MSNPFQDQLLKAGIVSKQQVQKANQEKSKKHKQKRNHNQVAVDKTKLKTQQAAKEKAERDRELNRKKEEQAKNKAISIEIDQLIRSHRIERDDDCDIVYNFEHRKKINRIYVNEALKQQIVNAKAGIARIEGRYELVPADIAEKIKQRNEKRIVILKEEQTKIDADDPYADYQVPDDLTW